MGIDILGLKSKDEARLKQMLRELSDLNESLSAKYSLKADLRELTNKSFTVAKVFNEELAKIRSEQQNLQDACDQTLIVKSKIEECLQTISEIEEKLDSDETGVSLYDRIVDLTSEESIQELENSKRKILDKYNQLFVETYSGNSIVENLSIKIKEIEEKYIQLFEEKNEDGENIFGALETKISKTSEIWEEYFKEDEYGKNKSELIDRRLKEINQFHLKVFGDESSEKVSLDQELSDRLKNLKDIEKRAKEILDDSSEAGLAGGFVTKRREANWVRLISLLVFISAIVFLFIFNYNFLEKKDFEDLKWGTILFKLSINAPIIWIATIANINMNKYSRLEQDYSHKEALAKSYERYRSEIKQLELLGVEGSENLKVKLLETNLDAFKINPASYSSDKNSDISIIELIKLKLSGSR